MALKKEEKQWRQRLLADGFKYCPSCGEIKVLGEYNKCRTEPDGLNKECRDCSRARSREQNKDGPRRTKRRERRKLLIQGLKDCTRCKAIKPVDEFGKKASRPNRLNGWCKVCEAEYHAGYHGDPKNKEKVAERKRSWRARNPEKVEAYEKQYYAENKERKLAYRKIWHQEHKEEQNAKARKRIRQWIKDNPERHRINVINRRAREKGAEGSFTEGEWLELLELCDSKCLDCGVTGDLTKDHVVPIANGGLNYISNIQPLCKSCNCAKGARHEQDWRPKEVKRWVSSISKD